MDISRHSFDEAFIHTMALSDNKCRTTAGGWTFPASHPWISHQNERLVQLTTPTTRSHKSSSSPSFLVQVLGWNFSDYTITTTLIHLNISLSGIVLMFVFSCSLYHACDLSIMQLIIAPTNNANTIQLNTQTLNWRNLWPLFAAIIIHTCESFSLPSFAFNLCLCSLMST